MTEADLDFFQRSVEQDGAVEGSGEWEKMMEKTFSTFSYAAWRRTIHVRSTPLCMPRVTGLLLAARCPWLQQCFTAADKLNAGGM